MRHHCSSDETFSCVFGQEGQSMPKPVDGARRASASSSGSCIQAPLKGTGKKHLDTWIAQDRPTGKRHLGAPPSYADDSEQQLPRLVYRVPRRRMPLPPAQCLSRDRRAPPHESFEMFHREQFIVPPKPSLKHMKGGDALFKRIANL